MVNSNWLIANQSDNTTLPDAVLCAAIQCKTTSSTSMLNNTAGLWDTNISVPWNWTINQPLNRAVDPLPMYIYIYTTIQSLKYWTTCAFTFSANNFHGRSCNVFRTSCDYALPLYTSANAHIFKQTLCSVLAPCPASHDAISRSEEKENKAFEEGNGKRTRVNEYCIQRRMNPQHVQMHYNDLMNNNSIGFAGQCVP